MIAPLWLAAVLALPNDVRAYVVRRDLCEHYAGEEAFDAARGRALQRALRRNGCATLDRDRRRLRLRFSAPAVRRELRPLIY